MKRLLAVFRMLAAGIEVITSRINADEIRVAAGYATRFELAGQWALTSITNQSMVELGRLAPLPKNIKPVWELLR